MSISISLKDVPVSDLHLHFITDKTKTSSSEYVQAVKDANSCLEALQIIKQQNEYMRLSRHQTESIRTSSPEEPRNVFIQDKHFTAKQLTEELDVYKALLYNGDITQEEYDQKRKQLLDLK